MLIFLVLIATIIMCIGILVRTNSFLSELLTGVSIAFLIVLSIMAMLVNILTPGNIEANKKLYESLTYQLENNIYDSDNNIGKSELYDKITDWNTDLARGKAMEHNIWVGIFWSDMYDEFDFIEFPEGG